MAQFAAAFVPFALQAATTGWQQYQQYDAYQRQQAAQAAANQASAQAARTQAEAQATRTAETANMANLSAWQEHDAWAAQRRRDSETSIEALNSDFARTEMERADALRRNSATQRARFAAMGLDAAAGSASAVLAGLGGQAATQTQRNYSDVNRQTKSLYETTNADIASGWNATARQTADRSRQANLGIWQDQVNLNSQLYQMGVQQTSQNRQNLLDLTVSNQRAALGLFQSGMTTAGGSIINSLKND